MRLATLLLLPAMAGCIREERDFRGERLSVARLAEPASERRAYDVSEGKRLYLSFNCAGCHSLGGGGMGPPLMDAEWIYGGAPDSVYATIVHGRPNGMPAFGERLQTQQVWQLVAYVRSLSGLLGKTVTQGRDDDMQLKRQEQSQRRRKP